ncbi:MAG: hypothetical protein H7A25_23645 [Leptospiraceae bacterium]|nr:hypothetical protein [Leptospiraceae bacterium]MCP5502915.1 hypothetical protein [Leptospiraceae bacterium]
MNLMDRRKRLKFPKMLLVSTFIFMLLPVTNYYLMKEHYSIATTNPIWLFKVMSPIGLFLFFLPFMIAIGLLRVKKWAWWLLLVYSIFLISYNFYSFLNIKDKFHLFNLLQTVFGLSVLVYFLKKDISAPYFKMYPRGWRGEKRYPIQIPFHLEGFRALTKDLSVTGFYATIPNSSFIINQEVPIRMEFGTEVMNIKTGVVRIDPEGTGFAFRDLDKESSCLIEMFVKKWEYEKAFFREGSLKRMS